MKQKQPFVFLEHTADIKFRAYGATLNEVFENATRALTHYLSGGEKIARKKGKVITVEGTDRESLLYNYLDELLYLLDAENFVVAKASIILRGNNLKAELYGDDAATYALQHVKAATYADMHMKKTESGWEAQVVLDV